MPASERATRFSRSTTASRPILVWFRNDLRLDDHPALAEAAGAGAPVLPIYLLNSGDDSVGSPGAASRWWLHHSLAALAGQLEAAGSRLVLRSGEPVETLAALAAETGARAVYWNRAFEPAHRGLEERVYTRLRAAACEARSFRGSVLHEPGTVINGSGLPYQVFTPFWKTCLARDREEMEAPRPRPRHLPTPETWPASDVLEEWALLPRIDWAAGMRATWEPGEAGATRRLRTFLNQGLTDYVTSRDFPARESCSRLSPHLHFGEISPRRVRQQVRQAVVEVAELAEMGSAFLRELGWREFAIHLLHHFPHTAGAPLRSEFARFPWSEDAELLRAWQQGRTGYPIVDAGMRQLWATGWMHNRVRMVVASFLVKDLLQPWQAGAQWFWDTLVDADLANNSLGWQWVAGCGADAAPYFRIFNPVGQGEKFDPEGAYVRRWVPELSALPAPWIHRPWDAPPSLLREAGIEPGVTYPYRIVEHGFARQRALAAFQQLKSPARDQGELSNTAVPEAAFAALGVGKLLHRDPLRPHNRRDD